MIHVFGFLGALISGAAVATGAFAFILVIGIIPRILRKSGINRVILVENIIIAGLFVGNLSSLWKGHLVGHLGEAALCYSWVENSLGHLLIIIYGVATGIFVGCVAVALAEILHTIPIMLDRFKLKRGLKYIILSMALGKFFGNILYFAMGYSHF